jgi:hypothetical protein
MYLRDIVMMLALLLLVGANAALAEESYVPYANPSSLETKNLTFNMEQNVKGTGFFSAYKYALMPDAGGEEGYVYNGVEAKNKVHGSGQIDADSLMYAESKYMNRTWIDGAYDEDGELVLLDDEAYLLDTEAGIVLDDDSEMTYSPQAMTFNSLLNEHQSTKNRGEFNSISHDVRYAHALDLLLESEADIFNNSINVDENITDGQAHFGVVQLAGIPRDELLEEEVEEGEDLGDADGLYEKRALGRAMKAWHKPDLEIDEVYVGSFHIKKGMNLYVYEDDYRRVDNWLPCCFGGFSDMNIWDQTEKKSARGIFDCTCFKVPRFLKLRA